MNIAQQVEEALAAVRDGVLPHIAKTIEPGAILYSSWGYEQTNVNYYMVTRSTAASCWIVPMRHLEVPSAGYSPMSGHTTPLGPLTETETCSRCGHDAYRHQTVCVIGGLDYRECSYGGEWNDAEACSCRDYAPTPIVPQRHKIQRYNWDGEWRESVRLTSYASAYLWGGRALYASHYA